MFVDGNALLEMIIDGGELRLRPIDQLAVTMNRGIYERLYRLRGIQYDGMGRKQGFWFVQKLA